MGTFAPVPEPSSSPITDRIRFPIVVIADGVDIGLFVRHGLVHAEAAERLTLDEALRIATAKYMTRPR
jgi:hypothetical protein